MTSSPVNLAVDFCGVCMKNPITTASGTFHPQSSSRYYDLSKLGAVTVKGVASSPWPGNPTPRIAEVYGGMLNSVGLQNPGADEFIRTDLPFLRQYDTRIIVNVAGHSIGEYCAAAEKITQQDVDLLELNISCPNIREGGAAFGTSAKAASEVVRAVKKVVTKPLIVKLTPNVTDITEIAKACEEAGADAISLINTLLGMKIDVYRRRPVLASKMGGLSGPCIKPVAVRMVYQVSHAVSIPVLGMGGIRTGEDAAEFIMAGASMVAVGTAALCEPAAPVRILQELTEFLQRTNVSDINEIRGIVS